MTETPGASQLPVATGQVGRIGSGLGFSGRIAEFKAAGFGRLRYVGFAPSRGSRTPASVSLGMSRDLAKEYLALVVQGKLLVFGSGCLWPSL